MVMPTPDVTMAAVTPGAGSSIRNGCRGARRVHALPAFLDPEFRDSEDRRDLGQQDAGNLLGLERIHRRRVAMAVADDERSVRPLREHDVRADLEEFRALGRDLRP